MTKIQYELLKEGKKTIGIHIKISNDKILEFGVGIGHGKSMKPTIKDGDLILYKVVPLDTIKVGDIVLYYECADVLTVHRVIEIKTKKGKLFFKVKGDANWLSDGWKAEHDIIGKVILFDKVKGGIL